MSESAFFLDLAILMTAAGVVSVICARRNWPKIIGYILAGVLMSEHLWGECLLQDAKSVQTIGQLGVVFLMFAMGLDFSTSDINRMKTVTVPVALIDTIVMTWLGYTVGTRILGWEKIPSLFLGAAICDSATTMLAKVIDEMKWGAKNFVKFTLGTSVCEDILCVGMIAVITGVAHGKGMDLGAACYSMGGLLVFFIAVVAFGFVFVPRLLLSVYKRGSEVLILTILGCLFFVSYIAYCFDFSLALGAFLVGILGAASAVRKEIAELVSPLRSMFAAVFFVSIGLLVDPMAWLLNLPAILLVSAIVVVGKFVNCTIGALFCGERVKTAVQMGMSLAQIGEFAFMVALLYTTCTNDANSPMYQIVIAASVVTTLLNPLMIRKSERVGEWVESKVPARVASALEAYRGFVDKYRNGAGEEESRSKAKSSVLQLGVLAVLIFAVSTVCGMLPKFDYSRFSEFLEDYDKTIFFFIFNIFAFSLVPAIAKMAKELRDGVSQVLVPKDKQAETGEGQKDQKDRKLLPSLRDIIAIFVNSVVGLAFLAELIMIDLNLLPNGILPSVISLLAVIAIVACFWGFIKKACDRASERINEALSADERREKLAKVITYTLPEGALHRLPIGLESPAIGENVVSLNIRAKTGASIISVKRRTETIRNVGPELAFESGDILTAMGDNTQIAALKDLLGITA